MVSERLWYYDWITSGHPRPTRQAETYASPDGLLWFLDLQMQAHVRTPSQIISQTTTEAN